MENPFELIEKRFDEVLKQLTDIRQLMQANGSGTGQAEFMQVSEVVPQYMSKATFYQHVREGNIQLYKIAGMRKSYVKRSEFFALFQPISF